MMLSRHEPEAAPVGTKAGLPILVHAPLRRDAELICEVVRERGHEAHVVVSADALPERLEKHDAVLVCTQEGLTRGLRERLEAALSGQPAWSRLPLVLILDRALDNVGAMPEIAPLMVAGDVIVLHRPMRPLAFTTALDAALASRRRQLEIRDHLRLQEELKRELHHRVKNALTTFLAIYRISLRQSRDLEELDRRFGERAEALVAVQTLLDDRRGASGDIRGVAEAVLAPYFGGSPPRITLEGPDRPVSRRFAFAVSLILNELATNAAKYGGLVTKDGRVAISWAVEGEDFRLDWRESGGPAVERPERTGYGTRFIETSARGLRATSAFDFRPQGLHFSMAGPATALEGE